MCFVGISHKLDLTSPKLWKSTGTVSEAPFATGPPVPVASELKLESLVQTIIQKMTIEFQVYS